MDNIVFPYSQKEAQENGIESISNINYNALFPTRMRELRRTKDVSQDEAATNIGVTRSTIGLYENGDNIPDIKKLVRIANYYDVSVDYLLGIDERPRFDFEYIGKMTGLSDTAIIALGSFSELSVVEKDNTLKAINILLTTDDGRNVLFFIANYLYGDLRWPTETSFYLDDKPIKLSPEVFRTTFITQIHSHLIGLKRGLENSKKD